MPNADFSCVRRSRSNTPLQALTTLNETLFVEAAQALALRTLREAGPEDDRRMAHAFRLVLGRWPDASEKADLKALYRRQLQRVADGWLDARDLAAGGKDLPQDLPKGSNPTQLAALTAVTRVLLNLDETFTRE